MHEVYKVKKRSRTPRSWSRGASARPHFCAPELDASYLQLKRAAWI